jgi:uncharacterized protein YmfQ (DUF2313 family)
MQMKTKRVSVFTQTVIAGVIALSGSASVSVAQASQPQASPPSVERMDQHWQSVIQERDPARRQVLVNEHRRMMAQAQKAMATGMAHDANHRDLMHTTDMHSIMLDMMK